MLYASDKSDAQLEGALNLEFSYTTSQHPAKNGPAADAFLVPAVWFEVKKVWIVSFSAKKCQITGTMAISIVANAELEGFAFTTANDIETRTLPLMSDLASSIDFRFTACEQLGECCRTDAARGIDDAAAGCKATTLQQYCEWKYEGFPDEQIQACRTSDPAVDGQVLTGEQNWLEILDRNYKHHEKARLMKTASKEDVVDYKYSGTLVRWTTFKADRECTEAKCTCKATEMIGEPTITGRLLSQRDVVTHASAAVRGSVLRARACDVDVSRANAWVVRLPLQA